MIMSDSNRNTLTNNKNEPVKEIRCENLDINNQAFCIELMKQMELNNNYVIIYTNSIDNLSSIRSINDEIADYIEKHENEIESFKSGVAVMAVMNSCPVLPIYMKKPEGKRRKVLVVGEPIDLEYHGKFPSVNELEEMAANLRDREIELENYYKETYDGRL